DRDGVHLGAEGARGDRGVGAPVALRRKAIAVRQRAERTVAAGDRIADRLDEAAGWARRVGEGAAPDGEADELRVALRALGLAVELDGVRSRSEPGDQAGGLLAGRDGE